jgi:hypothetical protein
MDHAAQVKIGDFAAAVPIPAKLATAATAVALVALALLHPLRPDLSPLSHMISEYGVGPWGWLMAICFGAFATGSGCVLALGWARLRGVGRVGMGFVTLATLGLAMAALFPVDPAGTPEHMSFSGRMHGVSFLIGVPGELLGVLLSTIALRRRALSLLAACLWVSLGLMVYAMATAGLRPGVQPHGWFGLPNRTFMTSYALWLAVAARALSARTRYES